jgi:hypothetical protein
MPKPFGGIESSSFNSKVNPLMNSNFKLNPMSNGSNNSNAVNNSSSNKYTMSPPPLPLHNHHNNSNNHHQNNNLDANEYKPSVAFLNSNINQRFLVATTRIVIIIVACSHRNHKTIRPCPSN